jgi:iron complex outermembrane receptor protein
MTTELPTSMRTRRILLASAALVSLAAASISGASWAQTAAPVDAGAKADSSVTVLPDIVVTATRRSENLAKVPLSVEALSQQQLDTRGIKQFSDLVRFTPGVNLTQTGGNAIAIRGISSSAGAGTTGVYIDDVPIQVRNLGFSSTTSFPAVFDLDRVEVLRGPQGTLFGAGSEGGTVRFIQTQPSLTNFSGYARSELSTTSLRSRSPTAIPAPFSKTPILKRR